MNLSGHIYIDIYIRKGCRVDTPHQKTQPNKKLLIFKRICLKGQHSPCFILLSQQLITVQLGHAT